MGHWPQNWTAKWRNGCKRKEGSKYLGGSMNAHRDTLILSFLPVASKVSDALSFPWS